MRKTMIDILACPIDKTHPLELVTINENDDIISEGILSCTKCKRFYPIIEDIPIMLPDELRDKNQEINFLTRFKDKIPKEILTSANPWHL